MTLSIIKGCMNSRSHHLTGAASASQRMTAQEWRLRRDVANGQHGAWDALSRHRPGGRVRWQPRNYLREIANSLSIRGSHSGSGIA